jgi:hypothetical protein
MPALVAGIHVLKTTILSKDVDGRDKPGHDDNDRLSSQAPGLTGFCGKKKCARSRR